ncbi:MAG: DUF6279 family lipoprotein [Pseudomonadota bacterium]
MRLFPRVGSAVFAIIGLLGVALLSACGAPTLVYNNAPELVHWWLDGYVDLDTAQSVQVRSELADIQQWHRQTELPRLATLLRSTAQRMPEPLTADAVCSVYAEVLASGERLSVKAEPAVVALAASLTPAQVQQLERKYAKSNADYRAKWLGGSATDMKERRYTELLDRAESVYGRLAAPQRDLLRQQVLRATFDAQTTYAIRVRHQQDAVQVLQQIAQTKPGLTTTRDSMRALLARRLRAPDAAQRRYADALVQDGCAGVAVVHNSTTPAQRAQAARKLNSYADDAMKLARRGVS